MDAAPASDAILHILHPGADIKQRVRPVNVDEEQQTRGRQLELTGDHYLIGRAEDCHIVLDDLQVSRRHARIERNGEFYDLVDLGSYNGTFLNGKKLKTDQPRRLHDDDVIRVAGIELGFFRAPAVCRVPLSGREREVLKLIKQGCTDKQIGRELDIAVPTVRAHIKNMFEKTGAKSRAQLVSLEQ